MYIHVSYRLQYFTKHVESDTNCVKIIARDLYIISLPEWIKLWSRCHFWHYRSRHLSVHWIVHHIGRMANISQNDLKNNIILTFKFIYMMKEALELDLRMPRL